MGAAIDLLQLFALLCKEIDVVTVSLRIVKTQIAKAITEARDHLSRAHEYEVQEIKVKLAVISYGRNFVKCIEGCRGGVDRCKIYKRDVQGVVGGNQIGDD